MWVRLDSLSTPQILFESGLSTQGLSLTLGDADGDTQADDVRFRVLGKAGNYLTVDADISRFADPTKDFVQITAVINDQSTTRGAQIYVNGALAGSAQGISGANFLTGMAHTMPRWEGYLSAIPGETSKPLESRETPWEVRQA